jgi:anti-sigma regulatory factor (Ser/Thr protein kinase)
VIPVADASQVGEARRAVASLTAQMGIDEENAGRVAIVVTELAANVARHGGGGSLLVRAIANATAIEVIAIDKGPGMADLQRALRDGYSTGGTAGKGLGAVRRMSSEFDVYTRAGEGTAVVARMLRLREGEAPRLPLRTGVINVAAPGETASGDSWALLHGARGPSILVVDGLGHGTAARQAAVAAVQTAERQRGLAPAEYIAAIHRVLQSTRGAALAVAEIDLAGQQVVFAGVGNISGVIIDGNGNHSMPSMNGTVGHEMRRVQEFRAPFVQGAMLIMHSDGIQTRWRLDQYPGIRPRDPSLAGGVIFRDFLRGRDDATIVTACAPPPEAESA